MANERGKQKAGMRIVAGLSKYTQAEAQSKPNFAVVDKKLITAGQRVSESAAKEFQRKD